MLGDELFGQKRLKQYVAPVNRVSRVGFVFGPPEDGSQKSRNAPKSDYLPIDPQRVILIEIFGL